MSFKHQNLFDEITIKLHLPSKIMIYVNFHYRGVISTGFSLLIGVKISPYHGAYFLVE